MLIQKVLGRWIALLKQNVGTTKKSFITASDLESCLKQAFKELEPEIIEATGEGLIPELGGDPMNAFKGSSGAKMAETLKNLFGAGIQEEEKEEEAMFTCGECDKEEMIDMLNPEAIAELTKVTEENLAKSNEINAIMAETINIMKDPNISPAEKLKLVESTRARLIDEKTRLQKRIKKSTSKISKLKDNAKGIDFDQFIDKDNVGAGDFKAFLKALKNDDINMEGVIVKYNPNTGKSETIKLSEKKDLLMKVQKLLKQGKKITNEKTLRELLGL